MQPDNKPLVLSNARLVLADRVIEAGWIAVVDGMIGDFGCDRPPAGAEDVGGDFIIPGLIELHTDHLEAHYMPRPKVYWDPVAAVVSYDGQLASCGITTVLDSLRVWREDGAEDVDGRAGILAGAIATAPFRAFDAMAEGGSYCAERYRSYDPASGTFVGYDGRRHPCR